MPTPLILEVIRSVKMCGRHNLCFFVLTPSGALRWRQRSPTQRAVINAASVSGLSPLFYFSIHFMNLSQIHSTNTRIVHPSDLWMKVETSFMSNWSTDVFFPLYSKKPVHGPQVPVWCPSVWDCPVAVVWAHAEVHAHKGQFVSLPLKLFYTFLNYYHVWSSFNHFFSIYWSKPKQTREQLEYEKTKKPWEIQISIT